MKKLFHDVGIDFVINSSFFFFLHAELVRKNVNNATKLEKKSDICFGLS